MPGGKPYKLDGRLYQEVGKVNSFSDGHACEDQRYGCFSLYFVDISLNVVLGVRLNGLGLRPAWG